jgi:hypothetical protein
MAYVSGMNDSAVVSGTYTISSLPSPWADQDIGSVGVARSGAFDATTATYTVQGSGFRNDLSRSLSMDCVQKYYASVPLSSPR